MLWWGVLFYFWFSRWLFSRRTTKRNRFNSSFSIHFSRSGSEDLLLFFLLLVYLFFVPAISLLCNSKWCKTMRCNKLSLCKYISCELQCLVLFQHCHCILRTGRDERLRSLLIAMCCVLCIGSSRLDDRCHVKSFQRQWNTIECLCGVSFPSFSEL